MKRISDTQLAVLITKAADPAQFNSVPADKVIVSRDALQTLLENLSYERSLTADRTAWMDVATELADDLRSELNLDNYSDAPEGTALFKFTNLAQDIAPPTGA